MSENLNDLLARLQKSLPAFPDGRINYTDAPEAAVLSIFLAVQGEILLLKRSSAVGTHREVWCGPAGYLDELVPIEEKVKEELREELSLTEADLPEFQYGEEVCSTGPDGRIWHIYPVRVNLAERPEIILDYEHTEYVWIKPSEMKNYQTVPSLFEAWQAVERLED